MAKKGTYVDGFVLSIPKKNVAAYRKMAKEASQVWKKFGALQYMECIGEDLKLKGPGVPFPKLAKAKKGEVVWFSFVVYKSKKDRDAINKKVYTYFGKKYEGKDMSSMPFDMKRMSYGGFKVEVSA